MVEIVFIDQNKFLRDMVEYSIKADGGTVFTLDSLAGQVEIIRDLSPKIVVLSLEEQEDKLSLELDNLKLPCLALIDSQTQTKYQFLKNHFVGEEYKPLSPRALRAKWLSKVEK